MRLGDAVGVEAHDQVGVGDLLDGKVARGGQGQCLVVGDGPVHEPAGHLARLGVQPDDHVVAGRRVKAEHGALLALQMQPTAPDDRGDRYAHRATDSTIWAKRSAAPPSCSRDHATGSSASARRSSVGHASGAGQALHVTAAPIRASAAA